VLPNLKIGFPASVVLLVVAGVVTVAPLLSFLVLLLFVDGAAVDASGNALAHSGTPAGAAATEAEFFVCAPGVVELVVVALSAAFVVVLDPSVLVPKRLFFRGVCTSSINRFSRSRRSFEVFKGSKGSVKGADVQ